MKSSKRRTFVALINITMLVIAVIVISMKFSSEAAGGTIPINDSAEPIRVNNFDTTMQVSYTVTPQSHKETEHVRIDDLVSREIKEPEITCYYDMSDDDVYELATLVYLESGGESFDCQCAVASVVLNRMTTRDMTLQEVIYEENQFSPAYLISSSSPSDSTLEAVRYILRNGPTLPEYVTYFRADYYFSWVEPYTYIDHTYFSYDTAVAERLGY